MNRIKVYNAILVNLSRNGEMSEIITPENHFKFNNDDKNAEYTNSCLNCFRGFSRRIFCSHNRVGPSEVEVVVAANIMAKSEGSNAR